MKTNVKILWGYTGSAIDMVSFEKAMSDLVNQGYEFQGGLRAIKRSEANNFVHLYQMMVKRS